MQCDEFTVFRRKSQKLIDIYTSGHTLQDTAREAIPFCGPAAYVPSPLTVPAIRVLTPPK